MSQTIEKKVLAEYFDQLLSGQKTFELRLADWQCQPGDTLILHEVDDKNHLPTGRSLRKHVGYVLQTKGLQLFSKTDVEQYGYQIISLLDEVPV